MKTDRLVALLILTVAIDGASQPADEQAIRHLEDVVVSVRGRQSAITQTPGGIGLLDIEDIRLERPASITHAMRLLPGIEKASDSPWGSAISIRGLGRNRVVFLIDGVRITTATDFNAQFGFVNPDDTDRIEVLKGPISSLYGSGSIGGVVNVLTRTGRFTEELELHGGISLSYETNMDGFSSYAWGSVSDERMYALASVSHRAFDEYEDADGDALENSQFDDRHGKLKIGWRWDATNTTELTVMHVHGHEIGIPGTGLATLPGDDRRVTYPNTTLELYKLSHTLTPNDSDIWTQSVLSLYATRNRRRVRIDNIPPTTAPAYPVMVTPEADHVSYGGSWMNTFELDDHTLVWGLDAWTWSYKGERTKYIYNTALDRIVLRSDDPLADSSQYSLGVFSEDSWRLTETLTLSVGGRVDRIVARTEENTSDPRGERPEDSFHDVSWNAHGGLSWSLTPRWDMSVIVASSYRAPDLLDRFKVIILADQGQTLYGTPDLDPERSLFAEYAVHYTGDAVRGSTSLFVNQINDLIAAVDVDASTERMQNISKADIWGVEAAGEWRFAPGWLLHGTVSYLEGKNRTDDDDLRFIAPLNGMAGLRYDHPSGIWGGVDTDWAAHQSHTPAGTPKADSWAVLNAKLGYHFAAGRTEHDLLLAVDNLSNADYVNYLSTSRGVDLVEPGVNVILSWRMSF